MILRSDLLSNKLVKKCKIFRSLDLKKRSTIIIYRKYELVPMRSNIESDEKS